MDFASERYGRYVAIKYESKETHRLLDQIEKAWKGAYSNYEFEYFFLDVDFDRQYREETQLAQVLTIFAVVIMIWIFKPVTNVSLKQTLKVKI